MRDYTSKELLNQYLGTLKQADQEKFMDKYQRMNNQTKDMVHEQIRNITSKAKKFQEGGLAFNQPQEPQEAQGGQGNPLAQVFEEYLATFKKEPKTINVNKFREYLNQ